MIDELEWRFIDPQWKCTLCDMEGVGSAIHDTKQCMAGQIDRQVAPLRERIAELEKRLVVIEKGADDGK